MDKKLALEEAYLKLSEAIESLHDADELMVADVLEYFKYSIGTWLSALEKEEEDS